MIQLKLSNICNDLLNIHIAVSLKEQDNFFIYNFSTRILHFFVAPYIRFFSFLGGLPSCVERLVFRHCLTQPQWNSRHFSMLRIGKWRMSRNVSPSAMRNFKPIVWCQTDETFQHYAQMQSHRTIFSHLLIIEFRNRISNI